MKKNIKIAPSILSANFSSLGEEISDITKAGADYIHIDVMDGNFVSEITIGSCVVRDIRLFSSLPFDVHLMVNNPEKHILSFAEAGADIITFHAEASIHIDRTVKLVKSLGKKVGISLVPSTPIHILEHIIDQLDLILVMSVNPGFGGQEFLPSQLKKISSIRSMIDSSGKEVDLEVDGGINFKTAGSVISAGANVLVSGSSVFEGGYEKYQGNIENLRNK